MKSALNASDCACFNLRRAARLMAQVYDRHLDASGLTNSQFTLLAATAEEGPRPITDLAHRLGMDRTTLTRNLNLVERKGYVRIHTGEDARVRNVQLTVNGRTALERARPLWEEAQARVVGALGRGRWGALLDELRSIGDLARTFQ